MITTVILRQRRIYAMLIELKDKGQVRSGQVRSGKVRSGKERSRHSRFVTFFLVLQSLTKKGQLPP
jgi:hypothetical protein